MSRKYCFFTSCLYSCENNWANDLICHGQHFNSLVSYYISICFNMRLTSVSHATQSATLSLLSCIWCSLCCIKCCLPSPLPCLDPITFKLYWNEQVIMIAQLGAASANHLANTVAMKTISSNHVAADQVFRNITSLPHLHIDFAVWYILI